MSPRLPGAPRGFTLTELVMTIAIIGILAVMVAPRFMSSKAFASRGFYDEAQAVVRYAQKTAIARRLPITVCVAANEIRAASDNTCTPAVTLPHPLTGAPLVSSAPDGVTLGPVGNFGFDGLGRPIPNAQVTLTLTSTITDDPARQIVVAAETGYVSR
jgi:MSHA pilin protein MshC